jgi:histidinol-phosphatase
MDDPRHQLTAADIDRYREAILALADIARAAILDHVAKGFDVRRKPDGSFVTSADVETERAMREFIHRQFADHGIIGEEAEDVSPQAPFQWIFDPIDGTEEFVNGIPTYGCIIGLHYQGWPVTAVIDHPALDLRLTAAFGRGTEQDGRAVTIGEVPDPARLRIALASRSNFILDTDEGPLFDALTEAFPNHRIYRSCYAHVLAATGQIDAMVEYGNHIWDLAATQLLVEEAGGRYEIVQDVRTQDGDHLLGAAFGRPAAVERIVSAVFRPETATQKNLNPFR